MPEVSIEVWKWRGATADRTRYDAAELEEALAQLSGSSPTDISLTRADSSSMIAGGHDGRHVMVFTPDEGVENWHAETLSPEIGDLPDLVVGGQAGDYEAQMRLATAEVRSGVDWFTQRGGMCPGLKWVRD